MGAFIMVDFMMHVIAVGLDTMNGKYFILVDSMPRLYMFNYFSMC